MCATVNGGEFVVESKEGTFRVAFDRAQLRSSDADELVGAAAAPSSAVLCGTSCPLRRRRSPTLPEEDRSQGQ